MDVKGNKIYKMKYYSHFDKKVHWKNVKQIVENPKMVAKHGFLQFIHYTQNIKSVIVVIIVLTTINL